MDLSWHQKISIINTLMKILKLKNKFKDIFLEKDIASKFKDTIINLRLDTDYEFIEKIINLIYISTIKHERNKCKYA